MSKTAYEIETELGGSGPNRTGFGGRPQMINFYAEKDADSNTLDVSSMPVLDSLTIDALRCGKIIPVVTIAQETPATFMVNVSVSTTEVKFESIDIDSLAYSLVYTIETKTWAAVF